MDETDYYSILDLKRNASRVDICTSYKAKALKLHPDLPENRDLREKLKEFNLLNEALEILFDEKKRAIYDVHGYEGLHYGVDSTFSGYCFLGNGREIFEEFFGTSNVYTAILSSETDLKDFFKKGKLVEKTAPSVLTVKLQLTLSELMDGVVKTITFDKDVLCQDYLAVEKSSQTKEVHFSRGMNPDETMVFPGEGNYLPGCSPCKYFSNF